MTWFVVDRVGLGFEQLRDLGPGAWVPQTPLLAAASCLFLLAGYLLSAALWARLVRDLGGPALPVAGAVRLFMVANLGRYVPGKVWQIAGLAGLARRRGVPALTATGAALLGQGIALAAATLVGCGALLGGTGDVRRWGVPLAGVVVVAVVLGTVPAVFRRVATLWFRLARQEAPRGLASVHVLQWFALYGLNWILYAFSFWMLVVSFGHAAPLVSVASAFAASYVVGYVAIFAPAGIGVREASLVALLTPHLGLGPAGAMAIVARLWTTLVEVVPAGFFWLHLLRGYEGGPINGSESEGE